MKNRCSSTAFAMMALGMAAACQSSPEFYEGPAVLARADELTLEAVRAALGAALGRENVALGPGDLTETSVISALPQRPSRYEDRSLAQPFLFDLELKGGACFAVVRETGARVALPGVSCAPA